MLNSVISCQYGVPFPLRVECTKTYSLASAIKVFNYLYNFLVFEKSQLFQVENVQTENVILFLTVPSASGFFFCSLEFCKFMSLFIKQCEIRDIQLLLIVKIHDYIKTRDVSINNTSNKCSYGNYIYNLLTYVGIIYARPIEFSCLTFNV